jgi:outer membrane protein assembly factor BamB
VTLPVETIDQPRRLRLWPGLTAVTLQLFVQYVLPVIAPETAGIWVVAGLIGAVAVLVWWAFFSRAPVIERVGAIVLIAGALFATRPFLDKSIATGMRGMMFALTALPVLGVALVAWAAATRRLRTGPRRGLLVGVIALTCGLFTLLRTDGVTGAGRSEFAWRWTKSWEEQLLAKGGAMVSALPAVTVPEKTAETSVAKQTAIEASAPEPAPARANWPGFRGPFRDGRVMGLRIKTDWASTPPVQLWRREVGPGWSSFAVADDRFYTQEQRGEFEVVACYKLASGEPVWVHRDTERFWESNAGAGPRGTPTLHGGRVYTFGATGVVNALNANDGRVVWTRNAATDTGAKIPGWGFASSPLVVDDLVMVAAAGKIIAYDRATGTPRWRATDGGASYSSPHLLTIDGVEQIVLMDDGGVTSFAPSDGSVLWKHAWPGGSPIVQPAIAGQGSLLIAALDMAGGMGTRRLAIAKKPDGWTAAEVWTSKGLKPYFNDFVVHDGHAFGFDGNILACVDLKDGVRKWKGGRYGNGQMLLLAQQNLLLVLSEEGEIALVRAAPDGFSEVARFPAMHDKTWNHPVVTGEILLVRNGQEMIAFRLPVDGG